MSSMINVRQQLVSASGVEAVLRSLAAALAGGPPIAALPEDGREQARARTAFHLDQPVAEDDAAAVLSTSGSTGPAKAVVLSRSAIMAAVRAAHDRLGGPGNWILALAPHYVGGLMVVARTILAGTDLALADPRLRRLGEATDRLRGRRYLSLVPTQLARACDELSTSARLAELDAVLVGGGAAPESLLARARDLGIRVVPTYGMAETCGGCVFDGLPLTGTTVEVEPSDGRIRIGGTQLFSGYRQDPELMKANMVGTTFQTSDRGRWLDGRLHVEGRIDDVVISGGRKVDLTKVEQLAQERIDGEIVILGVPDAEWGTAVVAISTGPDTLADVRRRLAENLPTHALPKRLVRVADIPRTAGGKVDRQRLVDEVS
jgi:o-succinylbenzoate---CoA ligase